MGLGTLVGLWARAAAVGGMALSLLLFLTVSFHASPYYTGSDVVFLFAWTPLGLGGAGGVLPVDDLLSRIAHREAGLGANPPVVLSFERVSAMCGASSTGTCQARVANPAGPTVVPLLDQPSTRARRVQEDRMHRRTLVLQGVWAGMLALVGLSGAAVAAGVGRLASSPASNRRSNGPALSPSAGGGAIASSPAPSTTEAQAVGLRPPGTRIGPASAVAVGGAASFRDPSSGDPAIVVRPAADQFLAFDAVCPHAGCIVQYDLTHRVFACPCHGSVFNGYTGAVEGGPAPTGLVAITVKEGPDGELYAT